MNVLSGLVYSLRPDMWNRKVSQNATLHGHGRCVNPWHARIVERRGVNPPLDPSVGYRQTLVENKNGALVSVGEAADALYVACLLYEVPGLMESIVVGGRVVRRGEAFEEHVMYQSVAIELEKMFTAAWLEDPHAVEERMNDARVARVAEAGDAVDANGIKERLRRQMAIASTPADGPESGPECVSPVLKPLSAQGESNWIEAHGRIA